jgi:ABC-type xylose transport system permease subunit
MMFQLPELGLLSLAMTIPLISGGLNLAIIATANQAALLMAWILTTQMPHDATGGVLAFWIATAFVAGFLLCLAIGFLTGVIVAVIGVHPILVTLGTQTLVSGISIWAFGHWRKRHPTADRLWPLQLGLDIRRRATAEPGVIAQSTKDHTRIVEAISARDQTRAGEAMKTHLANIEASTRRFALCAPPPIQKRQSV